MNLNKIIRKIPRFFPVISCQIDFITFTAWFTNKFTWHFHIKICFLFSRFSISFFLYIVTIIFPTWFLELENIRLKLNVKRTLGSNINELTTISSILLVQNTSSLLNQTNDDYYYDPIDSIALPIPDFSDDFKVSF